MYKFIFFVCFILCLSWNFGKQNISVELKKDLTIGDGSVNPDLFFSNWVQHLYVDESGYLFVADRNQHAVLKFSPEGKLTDQIGQRGRGPGEFEGLTPNVWVIGDTLFTYDSNLFRYSSFSLKNNELIRTVNLQQPAEGEYASYQPYRLYVDLQRGNVLFENTSPYSGGTGSDERYKKIHVYNEDLELIQNDLILLPADEAYIDDRGSSINVSGMLPFARKSVITQGIGDFGSHLCYGWTESISIECIDMFTGDTLTSIEFDIPEIHVTNENLNDALSIFPENGAMNRRDVRQAVEHDTWPAFNWFTLNDEGNFWIAANSENRVNHDLFVLDYDGNVIGQTILPVTDRIHFIRNGYAYATSEDDLGAKLIIRYKI